MAPPKRRMLKKWTEQEIYAQATNGLEYEGPREHDMNMNGANNNAQATNNELEYEGPREHDMNMNEETNYLEQMQVLTNNTNEQDFYTDSSYRLEEHGDGSNGSPRREDSNLNEEDWSQVKVYFKDTEWSEMPPIERSRCKIMMERYYHMVKNKVDIEKPFFMRKEVDQQQPGTRNRIRKCPVRGERTSSRLKGSQKRNYRESSPEEHPRQNVLEGSSSSTATASSHTLGRKPGGRIPEKEICTFDDMVVGLPNFGDKSLIELSKVRMNMSMQPINQDCKAHIRRSRKGNEYLSINAWNSYAKDVCDAYPNLKNEGEKYWESFKIGLQKSFSAERKRNKKKSLEAAQLTEDLESTNGDEEIADAGTLNKHPLDVEAEAASNELMKECGDRRRIKALLEKSLRYRKVQRLTQTPKELLELYPHLKIPEMMIFDYLISIEVTLEECERVFEQNMVLMGAHFETGNTSEHEKLDTLIKIHEYFVSKAVKKGLKPVFIVREEERMSLQEMKSSDIQAPFVVVLRRQDFVTGLHEVRSATLLMANSLVSSLTFPSADKIMLMLLAAYHTLNSEYPSPYQQFMRALEKIVTGKSQPSKYGRTQVQYERLMSLKKKR